MDSLISTLSNLTGIHIGEVVGTDSNGNLLVFVPGHGADLLTAGVVWMPQEPDWEHCQGLRVLVVAPDGEESPIVLALLDDPPSVPGKDQTRLPSKTLKLESERELLIKCGKSKIALRADGRIEIRGGYLLSRSSGANKIKGGSVEIN